MNWLVCKRIFHGSIFSYDAKNTREQGKLLKLGSG